MEVRHRFIITFLIESSRCLDGSFARSGKAASRQSVACIKGQPNPQVSKMLLFVAMRLADLLLAKSVPQMRICASAKLSWKIEED